MDWQRGSGFPVVDIDAKRIAVVLVQEDSGYVAKGVPQPVQLAQRLGAHQDPFPAFDRIPNAASVFGNAANKPVSPAILFHLGDRSCRVHRDAEVMGVKERNGLNAGRAGGGEAEYVAV